MTKTANDAFLAQGLKFDRAMQALKDLGDKNFCCDPNDKRNWGEVGSLTFLVKHLEEALEHYNINPGTDR